MHGAAGSASADARAEAFALSEALAAERERCARAEAALDALSQQLLQVALISCGWP